MKIILALTLAIATMLSTAGSAIAEDRPGGGGIDSLLKQVDKKIDQVQQKVDKVLEDERLRKGTTTRIEKPWKLEVGDSGRVLLRGTVEAVGSSTLMIRSWGGLWAVHVATSANIITKDRLITTIAPGDYVGVNGVISPTATLSIDAYVIRNRSWDLREYGTMVEKKLDEARERLDKLEKEKRERMDKERKGEN